ncbi:MAG: polyphosphate kinase 2 family protein [Acidimicrobiia bacterium]|nr:polyphosphate kinase 2 family protein [Acidimicrobiia bacterium]MDH4306729.1 polyphosphate kinase 2 family protein [Acidimicrobiia bacterium]
MIDTTPFLVPPGTPIDLSMIDPRSTGSFDGGKKAGRKLHDELNDRLELLQETLYAQGRHRLLVVLQATDTGGKDGTIRSVFDGVNPQGVKVASFKKPTPEELAHDYLWRVHERVPGSGEIAIFNRSHYEDVLVVRVHELVEEARWSRRYHHINEFEKMLADEGTTILKFFLHISKDEQKERLQARLDDQAKRWKFSLGDLDEREHWDDYQAAFGDMLSKTSTDWAPWYVIPADHKWFRDLLVSSVLVETLESLGLQFPDATEDLTGVEIE